MLDLKSLLIPPVYAQEGIINPAIGELGKAGTPAEAGVNLGLYIAILWQTAITISGLAVLAALILSGVEYVLAANDKSKIESAKTRMTNAVAGLIILMTVAGVSVFLSRAFKINLLEPQFQNLLRGE